MRTGQLPGHGPLPLLVEPEGSDDPLANAAAFSQWASANQKWIDDNLLKYGAILFRGFGVNDPSALETVASRLCAQFGNYVGGTTPRKDISGNVKSSTEAPAFVPIALHLEMSYLDEIPARVMFSCELPPKQGGQTPIADMAAVYRALDPKVRSRLEERGLLLIQNVPDKKSKFWPRTWHDMFGMDKAGVEKFCHDHGVQYEWLPDGSLRMLSPRPVTALHPQTGEKIWLNASIMHDSFSWELRRVNQNAVASLLGLLEKRSSRGPAKERRYHCVYGDGGEIPLADIQHIRQTYWDHAVMFDWQKGDFLLIDNSRVAHGRMPFKGPRRILTALSSSIPVIPAPTEGVAEPIAIPI